MTELQQSLHTLGRLVGCTPLLALDVRFRGEARRIYAKAENFNFTGSIKDRMALHILRKAHETGLLKPGAPIAEATSGNTGISFAALGRALGHPVTIFMPDWMSQERKDLIRSFGAQIRLVSAAEGGFLGSIRLSEAWAEETPGAFLPCQFANEANVEAHATTTGPEILAQLASVGLKPGAFVAGVGTGGTVMGVGSFLKGVDPGIQVHPVEPSNSPTLHTGHKVGKHRIQGISDEFIPAIVKLDQLDDILSVDDGDAILMAQKLADRGPGRGHQQRGELPGGPPGPGPARPRRGGGDGLQRQQQEVPLHRPDEGGAGEGGFPQPRGGADRDRAGHPGLRDLRSGPERRSGTAAADQATGCWRVASSRWYSASREQLSHRFMAPPSRLKTQKAGCFRRSRALGPSSGFVAGRRRSRAHPAAIW